ncbi:hypothetical protein FVEG_14612 [Fusarium verticillioides 7600]|uniref:Uncharacterized protein n=1 Tax=Gibberella moniliformis (strain M3125 / FGSC 7600) TaxID=334819 RepID=W7L917_GIBM7|nr:hypothetical protein FVEG_14612 [Fusarium verticillioides 7600]EWG36073.1 hypothetical protein FVEG_14612 [Fusarium verticillioides 7600]
MTAKQVHLQSTARANAIPHLVISPAKRHNRKARKNQHSTPHVPDPEDQRTRQGNANAVIWGSAYRGTLYSAGAFVSVNSSALVL